MREALQYLADNPDAPDYAARIDALIATPELLIDLLAERISSPGALLEVVTRRYYEIRALEDIRAFQQDGGQFVTGSYELAGKRLHLVSTVTDRERLSATLRAVDCHRRTRTLTTWLSTSICPGRTRPPTATNCLPGCVMCLPRTPA